MKKNHIFAWCMAAVLAAPLAGCGQDAPSSQPESSGSTASSGTSSQETSSGTESDSVTFPLAETVTFDIMVATPARSFEDYLDKVEFWTKLKEESNVDVNWVYLSADDPMSTLNAMFSAGTEGDAVMGGALITESNLSLLASNDLLTPLNEYIDDEAIMPNFNSRVLSESPNTKGFITCPDGMIYSLPKYTALDGNYLESPLWINKAWLDKAGLGIPKTLEELEAALIAFKEQDMNGNGKIDDEIPYLFLNGHSFSHMEALLGLWGIATKDSTLDSYVYVKDGKVNFAPSSDAYKDAIKAISRWYQNGLVWSEAFTGTTETYGAKLTGDVCLVGALTAKTPPTTNREDYVLLEPVAVEGYEPCWYRHPGRLGGKGMFSLTRSVENAGVLMHWIDLFYDLDHTVEAGYGEVDDGRVTITDGKYEFLTLDKATKEQLDEEKPTFVSFFLNLAAAYTADDYANRIVLSADQKIYQANYEVYKDYMTNEYWPRPYFAEEDTTRINELRTDIFNTVAEKKAAWVTGNSDIDADWDSYLKSLNSMGLEEFVQILQKTYDNFLAGTEN